MDILSDDPKFYCNKCLNPLRIFDETISSISTTGRSSTPVNLLTSCYHIICGACRPRITINQPAVCPICHKQCQMTEISRSALPAHKQFLFLPIAKSVQLLKMVTSFQDRQIDMFNDRMAKYHGHIKAKLLNEQKMYQLQQKKIEQLRDEQKKLKECYRLYKEYKAKMDKKNATQQRQVSDVKKPRYNRRYSGQDQERPGTFSQRRSSGDSHYTGDGSFQFNPSALAAPCNSRRSSSHRSSDSQFGQYASDEHRRRHEYPICRSNESPLYNRRSSRDDQVYRPSGVFSDSMASTPIGHRRTSNDRYKETVTTAPFTLNTHFSNADTLPPKPLATVEARRRFSIEIPETLVFDRMSAGMDTPQNRHPRDRYRSQRH